MSFVPTSDDFAAMRRAMIDSQLRTSGVTDACLLEAMASVPREDFVPESRRAAAYVDRVIPLEDGRAINPPLATALLLNAAALGPDDRVLLVGDASGYTFAIATLLAREVVTTDATPDAAFEGTFDVIVIDGAVEQVPSTFWHALAEGGRLLTGIVDNGVVRLAKGRAVGDGHALVPFADVGAVVLPAFARPREFVF